MKRWFGIAGAMAAVLALATWWHFGSRPRLSGPALSGPVRRPLSVVEGAPPPGLADPLPPPSAETSGFPGVEIDCERLRLPKSPALKANPEPAKVWPCDLKSFDMRRRIYRFCYTSRRQKVVANEERSLEVELPARFLKDCDLDRNLWLDPEEIEYAIRLKIWPPGPEPADPNEAASNNPLGVLYKSREWSMAQPMPRVVPYHAFVPGFSSRHYLLGGMPSSPVVSPPASLPPSGQKGHPEDHWIRQELGSLVDLDGNGKLAETELADARRKMLLEYDWDGNGQFDEDELFRLQTDARRGAMSESQPVANDYRMFCGWACHWLFLKANDQDGDGILDSREEGEAAEAELMRQYDLDRNGWLDLEEQLAVQAQIRRTFWPKSLLEPLACIFPVRRFAGGDRYVADPDLRFDGDWWRRATREAVRRFDRNGDGWLDRVETMAVAAVGERLKLRREVDLAAWWMAGGACTVKEDRISAEARMKTARDLVLTSYDVNRNGAIDLWEYDKLFGDRQVFMRGIVDGIRTAWVSDYDFDKDSKLDDDDLTLGCRDLFERFAAGRQCILSEAELVRAKAWIADNGKFEIERQLAWMAQFAEASCLFRKDMNDNGLADSGELGEIRKEILEAYDLDRNGRIGRREQATVLGDPDNRRAINEWYLRKLYAGQFDQDGNGGLDRKEMELVRQAGLAAYDKNRNGRFDDEECRVVASAFETLMLRAGDGMRGGIQAEMEAARKAEWLKLYDFDGDGVLNAEELSRAKAEEEKNKKGRILAEPIEE